MDAITITVAHDKDAAVWYVAESSLPWLNVEATSLDDLYTQLPLAVQDLLEAGDSGSGHVDVPINLIAHSRLRVGSSA